MNHASKHQLLIGLIEPICTDMGLELVELEQSSNPKGAVLRLYIDKICGANDSANAEQKVVSIAECEQVSRQVSATMDVEEPISYAYSLEVSSPGLDRPLRKPSHFNRFAGEEVKITLHQMLNGSRKFGGIIVGADEENVTIKLEGGKSKTKQAAEEETLSINIESIASARLVPDWDAIMGKAKKAQKSAKKSKKQSSSKSSSQNENDTKANFTSNQETTNPKGALMA